MTLHLDISTGGTSTSNLAGSIRRDLPFGGPKFTVKAEEGAVGGSEVYIDDASGSLDIVGLRRWWAWESGEDPGYQVIATGYIGPREIGRVANGIDDHMVGADRCWTVALNDHNQLLSRRLITGSDGDRPAETDIARLTWLLASSYLSGVDDTLGYVNDVDTTNLDASDLRGQSAYEVIRDCAQRSGKDFFLIRRGDTSPPTFGGTDLYSLWYDYQYSTAYLSTLRLTNVLADVDNSTTFAVHPDAKLRRTPDRTYSGVYVQHVNGAYYTQNVTTANTYGARDAATTDSNITTDSAAAALAATYLDTARAEEDRITCRFVVPHTKVNHLREGQAVQVKFSHFGSAYSAGYVYARCVERTVEQLSDTTYEISVELSPLGGSATSVMLQSPNGTNYPGDGFGGTWRVQWDNDGDSPGSGCSASARTGLLAYQGAAAERTGILCNGTGIVSVYTHGTMSGVGGGTLTFYVYVYKNGTVVGTTSQTTGGGLRALGWTWDLTVSNLGVKYGDVIEVYFLNPAVNIMVVPAGVGDCANMLYVSGTLR